MTSAHETPQEAARRLSASTIAKGYNPAALHVYCDAAGIALFYRIRLKHPNGEKWIRPMHHNGAAFVLGEPPAPDAGKPLYRLPQLLADEGPVYVVEGEACADALAACGVIATTSGSADSADAADWSQLRGRDVVIWPDNDGPGQRYAETVAAKLRAIAASIAWIDLAPLALPDHGDCVDWLAQHPNATADTVRGLLCVSAPDPSPPPSTPAGAAPEPLRRPCIAPPSYPLDALGECLGTAAARLHAVLQCPAALCGQSVLAAASLAVQAHADVWIDGRREPLSLWHVSVAESGERKSAADHWALRAHREHERDAADEYRQAHAAYTIAASAHKAAMSKAEKKADAVAIRAAMADAGDPPEPPLSPLLLLSEPTLEGLQKLYQNGRPSLGLFNDDAGDFLGGHAMNRDNRTKSAAGFSRLWDSGEFSRVRSGDGAAKFYGRRLALHVMVQPVIAERVLSDEVLTGQGFLARCLLSWPQSTIGGRRYVEDDLSADPAMLAYGDRMRFLLRMSPNLRAGTRNELDPRTLTLSPDAKRQWIAVANAIERDMAGEYADVKAWASKAGAQVLRIAGVLTLVDNDEAETIHVRAIERAAQLVEYHLTEAARIVGTARVPTHLRNAELLLDWCRRTERTLLYSADAMRNGPGPIRDTDTFREAVETLEAHGWTDRIEGGSIIDGKRRALVWQLRMWEAG
jgi:hypothetical protein